MGRNGLGVACRESKLLTCFPSHTKWQNYHIRPNRKSFLYIDLDIMVAATKL